MGLDNYWSEPMAAINKPNPGSKEAVEKGCLCPVEDNKYGKGSGYDGFWVSDSCPIHGKGIRDVVSTDKSIQPT